ncbi:protein FRA10AC1-like isoform X2 [Salvelinus fontinalis]|uniref:protein FRA10AC1-like isoform X2 n=1 Tax=Salvelinus fontinalis TaxID=8038 RepID=UPI0024862101|nr:protein FRA10AC1-like isoform X2 [Salvelinus fontinalis]
MGGGKGHFLCGNKLCEKEKDLKSWEVNFAHVEQGEKRNILVKLSDHQEKKTSRLRKIKWSHRQKDPRKERQTSEETQRPLLTLLPSNSEDDSQQSDKGEGEHSEEPKGLSKADHWKGPAPTVEEESREEELDEYFEDTFLSPPHPWISASKSQHARVNMQESTCKSQHARVNMQESTCKSQHARVNMQESTCKSQHARVNMQESTCKSQHARVNMQEST